MLTTLKPHFNNCEKGARNKTNNIYGSELEKNVSRNHFLSVFEMRMRSQFLGIVKEFENRLKNIIEGFAAMFSLFLGNQNFMDCKREEKTAN